MEGEKKIAVKARDFRAAKDLQKNIAELQQKLVEQTSLKKEKEDQLKLELDQLDAQQTDYEKMEQDLKLKTQELDLERQQKILARITALQVLLRSMKKKPDVTQFQITTLEIKLNIERSKITYICLEYDLPFPAENPLPLEEAEILPNVVVKENQAEEKKEGEEIVLESGLVVDETHVTPFVTPIVSTEVQQPPVHEQEHEHVVTNQKTKKTKKAEQKKKNFTNE